MIRAFHRALTDSGLVRRGDRILLAVSGGSDSVGLFHLFSSVAPEMKLKLFVAHFNHNLRGQSSAGDARFVRDLAASKNMPFSHDTAQGRPAKEGSLQEEARRQRLAFLLRTARRRRCRSVALGHTADDQAETMLMRFFLEGGPAALGGIPPSSHEGRIIHPLLGLRKADIRSWLSALGASWREDRSNAGRTYLRNRLRLDLVPLLEEAFNPRIVERLGNLASLLRRDNLFLEQLAGHVLQKVARSRGRSLFPGAIVEKSHPAVLSRALLAEIRALARDGADISSRHLNSILALHGGAGYSAVDLPGGITAGRDRHGILLLGPGSPPVPGRSFRVALPVPGTARFHRGSSRVTSWLRRRAASFVPAELPGVPWRCTLDAASVSAPLTVRSRLPGDRLRPMGAPGSKKLKSIMIDAGIPRTIRELLPVVCDREGIVWVAGLRPAHRCRVTDATERLLYLEARGSFRGSLRSP